MKYIEPTWNAPKHIKAYTTLRDAWTQLEVGDQDKKRPTQYLKNLLKLPENPIWIDQKHTAIAVEATLANQETIADASFTQDLNRVCIVLTADCLPVLICDKQGTKVAAVHAGWRGLASGVIENTVTALQTPASDLMVWLGPAIGPQKFEVGADVFEAFTRDNQEASVAFTAHTQGKWLADLYKLAKIRLQTLGISQIHGGEFCTYTQDNMFFSYRRDKGVTGRMASLIWIAH